MLLNWSEPPLTRRLAKAVPLKPALLLSKVPPKIVADSAWIVTEPAGMAGVVRTTHSEGLFPGAAVAVGDGEVEARASGEVLRGREHGGVAVGLDGDRAVGDVAKRERDRRLHEAAHVAAQVHGEG